MAKPRVLLVDSSDIVLDIEQRFLKEQTVTIFTARTGLQALSMARKIKPNLVYLDYSLSGMDGISCCRAIKADPELVGTPIVMIAGNAREVPFCLEAGCDEVLRKPLEQKSFLAVGLELLGRRQRSEQRILCRSTVACRLRDLNFYGTIEDISMRGMYIGTSQQLQRGDPLLLRFLLPEQGDRMIHVAARVTWLNSGQQRRNRGFPPGFGVLFEELRNSELELIQEFVERSMLRQHPPEGW